jgi:hypothetical protein
VLALWKRRGKRAFDAEAEQPNSLGSASDANPVRDPLEYEQGEP